MAVARCGSLSIPLRLGRVDATEAGIMGVPEAHTDIETTKKRFETASFSQGKLRTLLLFDFDMHRQKTKPAFRGYDYLGGVRPYYWQRPQR